MKYRGKCQDLLDLLVEWNPSAWRNKTPLDIWDYVMRKLEHDVRTQPGRYLHEKVLVMEDKLQRRDEARRASE